MTLKKANKLAEEGKLQEAFSMFSGLLKTLPKEANFYSSFATLLFNLNEFGAAIKMAAMGTKQQDASADTWATNGTINAKLGDIDTCTKSFKKVFEYKPDDKKNHMVYGAILKNNLRDYKPAIKHFEQAEMDAFNYTNIAWCHRELGDDDKAKQYFLDAIKMDSTFIPSYIFYINLCLDRQQYDEYHKFYKEQTQQKQSEYVLAILNIGEALALYLQNKTEGVKELLDKSKFIIPNNIPVIEQKIMNIMLIYHKNLWDLMKFQGCVTKQLKDKIYIIGDSHSFSSAGLNINNQEVISYLVMGCKIWHLADEQNNHFKFIVKNNLLNLAKGSKVVLMVGEIDCRDNEGFLPYLLKNPNVKPVSFIRSTLKRYICWVKLVASDKNLDITIFGVPAPNGSTYLVNTVEADLKLNIVRIVNNELKFLAKKHKLKFITSYKPDKNGWGEKEDFIDKIHLKPSIYVPLLEDI